MADNYFSSLPLAKNLEKKKTIFVGTIRRHRKEIPIELRTVKLNCMKLYYNKIKCVVDMVDQMARQYSVWAASRR